MKIVKLLPLVALFSIMISSCGKKSKLGKLIPKDAAVVVVIDQKSLLEKLPWEEIKQTYWYNQLMSDTSLSASTKAFLTDPAKTGIDLNSELISFVMNSQNGQHVISGNIKDSKAYADFLKNIHPDAVITKDGDLNIFKAEEVVAGWNNERFVVVGKSKPYTGIDSLVDSAGITREIPTPDTAPDTDSLVGICKNILTLKADNSLQDNERFADLEAEKGDLHIWINTGLLAKGAMGAAQGMMGMLKIEKFIEDNVTAATVSFLEGKISGSYKQYFGKELSDILKKGDGDIDLEMIRRLPKENVAGVYAMHFTPANLLEIVKMTGLDGFINIFMAQKGMSLEEVVKATKGDIVMAVSDIKIKDDTTNLKELKDTVSNYPQRPDATMLFAIAIGDKEAFSKLVNLGDDMKKDMTDAKTFQRKDDKYFAISNSSEALNYYFSGTSTDHAFVPEIKDYPTGGFIDLQMILKAMQAQFIKDSIGKVHYERNISMWNNVYFRGGAYKNGGLEHHAEINLVDTKTNSLKTLSRYIDDTYKIIKETRNKEKEDWKTDTIPAVKKDPVAQKKNKGRKARK